MFPTKQVIAKKIITGAPSQASGLISYKLVQETINALIVAAALSVGCEELLSEDLQHGQDIEGLRIKNYFLQTVSNS